MGSRDGEKGPKPTAMLVTTLHILLFAYRSNVAGDVLVLIRIVRGT
jgi:hypothetical protein